jgi:hypothetical protein
MDPRVQLVINLLFAALLLAAVVALLAFCWAVYRRLWPQGFVIPPKAAGAQPTPVRIVEGDREREVVVPGFNPHRVAAEEAAILDRLTKAHPELPKDIRAKAAKEIVSASLRSLGRL